jgi:hypothetical protein
MVHPKLAFCVHTDGLTNLMKLTFSEAVFQNEPKNKQFPSSQYELFNDSQMKLNALSASTECCIQS